MAMFQKNVDTTTVQRIHRTALSVMQKKGIRFVSERARNVFCKNGFKTEGEIVYFTEDQVMNALSKAPSQFTLHARDEAYDLDIGTGSLVFCPAYGPVFVSRNEEVSSAIHEDFVNFLKLCHTSDIINIMNPYVVTPCDVADHDLLMYQQACCLQYSSKPTMCITAGYEASKQAIHLVKKVNQKKKDDYVTIGLISALSPLSYDENMIGGLFAFAEEGQPIILGCGALPGATSPVSISGTMVTATAELLAGIVLAQLIHPGLPCIFGNVAAGTDLSYVTPAIGTPEAAKIAALSKAMSEFYHIPCRGGGALCDAKQTDFEAGAESTLVMFSTLASDIDFIIHAVGILDSFNIIGYEKFLLDEQNIRAIQFAMQPPQMDDEVMGLDTIMDVPHSKQYLDTDHTFEYMRKELFIPKICLHGYYDVWKNQGRQTLLQKADVELEKRLQNYQLPELSEEHLQTINPYTRINFKEV